ncbi:MAG: TetR/AcrR family transcriptional regulator [Herpetosiphonaceae bacterium]|nr:TetR/AcrR family transcriptional regulator [Herpetosiphonaceae bacterium]
MVTNYQEAKSQNREALRRGLLDAASRVLVSEGLEALTMRRVSQEVAASTKVLYTLFGNKEGLLEQLYVEGFERLRRNLEAVPLSDDPVADLVKVALAYRENALADPTYFAVLFGRSVAGFTPSANSIEAAMSGFALLEGFVQRAMEAGLLRPADVKTSAKIVWATLHGATSLELDGYFDDADPSSRRQTYQLAVDTLIKGLSRFVS